MNSEPSKLAKWSGVASNVVILAGLILVAYELNQNSQLARAALINDGTEFENANWQVLLGESPIELLAKSIECPEKMTFADYITMDSYYFLSMNVIYRNYELAKEGL